MQSLQDIMDSQRFDMSLKRSRQMSENTTRSISSSTDDMRYDEDLSLSSRRSLSIISEATSFLEDNEPLIFATNGHETLSTTPISSGSSTSATYVDEPSLSQGSSVNIEDNANCPQMHTTDVYEHDTHSTIRTIIRPITRSPLLRCFSPPSSPLSRTSSPSLKNAASALNLNGLGCFSSNTFEEEVDLVEQRRAEEAHNIQILVTHKVDERNEERLRAVVQQTAYENASGMSSIRSRVISVSPVN